MTYQDRRLPNRSARTALVAVLGAAVAVFAAAPLPSAEAQGRETWRVTQNGTRAVLPEPIRFGRNFRNAVVRCFDGGLSLHLEAPRPARDIAFLTIDRARLETPLLERPSGVDIPLTAEVVRFLAKGRWVRISYHAGEGMVKATYPLDGSSRALGELRQTCPPARLSAIGLDGGAGKSEAQGQSGQPVAYADDDQFFDDEEETPDFALPEGTEALSSAEIQATLLGQNVIHRARDGADESFVYAGKGILKSGPDHGDNVLGYYLVMDQGRICWVMEDRNPGCFQYFKKDGRTLVRHADDALRAFIGPVETVELD